MKVSYRWLQDYLPEHTLPASEELSAILTMTGLEVGGIEYTGVPGEQLQGVVVGEVKSVAPHPNADRLRVTQVDVGAEELVQIVCGAPNVAEGQKVPVATVGSTLTFSDGTTLKIKKSKLRGEASHGMICAEDELGLGDGHEGILVLETIVDAGTPLADVVDLQGDIILEIDLTPNRTDAMSHFGVARDYAAVAEVDTKLPALELDLSKAPTCEVGIEIADAVRCPRYSGAVIRGVNVTVSPDWLKRRLESIGQRSINTVVDITNYILHSIGQPMHAFDLSTIADGQVIIETAKAGTTFVTLDGSTYVLSAEDLVIANPKAPMVIAGVMGGLNSGVTMETTDIFLESAYFHPDTIRRTVKRHNIHTETAYRYERGTDPNITVYALQLAIEMVLELCGGEASQILDVGQTDFPPTEVPFSFEQCRMLIGVDLPDEQIERILQRLDISIHHGGQAVDADAFKMTGACKAKPSHTAHVPRYRADVLRQQDLTEEVIRIFGLNNVPAAEKVHAAPSPGLDSPAQHLYERTADALAAAGWREILTNSLVSREQASESSVQMLNPLGEEHAILRNSLLNSGLEVVAFNINRKFTNLKLFEFGSTYGKSKTGYFEQDRLVLFITGHAHEVHWQGKGSEASLTTLRQPIEQLQTWLNISGKFSELQADEELSYGLVWKLKKRMLGRLGKVSAKRLKPFGIKQPVYFADIDWASVRQLSLQQPRHKFVPIPKFPGTRRDISLELTKDVSYSDLEASISQVNPHLITGVSLFDVYEQLDGDNKSYAVGVEFQDPEKTLTDEAIDKIMDKIFQRLEKDPRVQVRRQ